MRRRGFTLIELVVVMAIVALLISIAAPRYFKHVDRAKEAVLRQSLFVMRDAIDKFHGDMGRYPLTLDELVVKEYLRKVPVDPLTESAESWVGIPYPGKEVGTYDVHSGAPGDGSDGTPYAEW